ncbi:MAG: 7-carboxy-7-deazaguanine synthase QueE [Planctomycetota bacterium]|nr:7-carboxy-7-deazaguanine synthase QueE [Planctomycetota bacterium]
MTGSSAKAPLIEVFHSIQGEGRFVGQPMTFLRVATCPIRCSYCDTPNSYQASAEFVVHAEAGERNEPNPVSAARAVELVVEAAGDVGSGEAPCVSVTGGEPLVAPQFVRELGTLARSRGFRVHLETAALDPAALADCIDGVDHLSADYKLPGTLLPESRHPEDLRSAHVACCTLAVERGLSVDVKFVLTAGLDAAVVGDALDDLAHLSEKIVLVLQPVTPFGAETEPLPAEELARHVAAARSRGFRLLVLPQVHRHLGLR